MQTHILTRTDRHTHILAHTYTHTHILTHSLTHTHTLTHTADLIESFLLSLYSLQYCSITDEGFRSLASAVRSNPSALRELWLDDNHPGPSTLQLFSELQKVQTVNISK